MAAGDRGIVADVAAPWRAGLAWALLGVVMFSFSLPLTKVAVRGFDPYLTATARATIAGVLAAPLLVANRVPLPERRHARSLAITMVGAVFGWPVLIALALQRTTSAHVGGHRGLYAADDSRNCRLARA